MGAAEEVMQAQRLPLSAAQLGIWLGQQLDPLSPAYWTAEAVELQGTLDIAAFEQALRQAIDACEALHMSFAAEGNQVWQTHSPRTWALRHVSLSDSTHSNHGALPWSAAWHWLQRDLSSPPDLNQGPLFATALLELAPDHHLWVLRAHHIALDGYGYALLMGRVTALYAQLTQRGDVLAFDAAAPRASLAAVVEEALSYQQQAEADRAFWVARLLDAAPPVSLAPPAPLAHGVRRLRGSLSINALEQWQAAARDCKVDWATWVMAAMAAWIARRSGATEVILGLPVMTRLGSKALSVPCMAMNIVPLRIGVDATQGMHALATAVAAEMRALRPHQRYRYEWLRHDLTQQRGKAAPLFGPVINLMPFERLSHCGDLQARQHPVSAGPVEDLSISVVPHAQGVRLDLEANPDAYDTEYLSDLQDSLMASLEILSTAAPDTPLQRLLASPELSIIQGEMLPTPVDILAALRAYAARTPHAPALEQNGHRLSYSELLQRVYQLAGVLVSQGVGRDCRVAVLLPRTPESIISLLAILWAGGGYVPLDPDSPDARSRMVLEDAAPILTLTHACYVTRVPAGQALLLLDEPLPTAAALSQPCAVPPDSLAYVIYTSGTTGRPNGVMIGRDALAHFVAGARLRYAMCANDRVLQFAPLHFDASVEEIFLALSSGACLVLRTDEMLESVPRFLDSCDALGISVLDLPTAFWHELAYALSPQTRMPAALRLVIIGGEAALPERVMRWRQHAPAHSLLLNTYGPTETTVICSSAALSGPEALDWQGESVPIGQPLPGVSMAVVDAALRPVRRGERGELCVMGGALARGYLGREQQTAARFVALSALPEAPRAYRTGDAVHMREDGVLVYLGRLDDEFKISGYRIDPTEIETALLSYPQQPIREVAVLGQNLRAGIKRLLAFVVLETENSTEPSSAELQAHLAQSLPAPAIPSSYLYLPRLPRNANNKIDRAALRTLAEQQADSSHSSRSPNPAGLDGLLSAVSQVCCEVLGLTEIAPDSDFFAMGGSSLQAIQVANRLGMLLQREVPVSSLFRQPSIAALAAALDVPVGHEPPAQQDPFAPLLCLQPGEGPALFCLPPTGGLSWCYMGLAAHLPEMPIYGLQAPGITGEMPADMDSLLTGYLAQIRRVQSQGPYHFVGWSAGGGIAHALAARLQAEGQPVALLAMMDAYPADLWADKPLPTERDALVNLLDIIGDSAIAPDGTPLDAAQIRERLMRPHTSLVAAQGADPALLSRLADSSIQSMLLYRGMQHPSFNGDVLYFRATQHGPEAPDWRLWQAYVSGQLHIQEIAASHHGMSRPLPLAQIGRTLAAYLRA